MKDLLDVHTHTVASGHAYSTVREIINAAKEKGLSLIGISDHGPDMPGSSHEIHFCNFKVIPRESLGIDVRMGVELNITDYSGSTDLRAGILKRVDYALASLHDICIEPGTKEQNTSAIIGAMRNPKVKIIGHPDNPYYDVDFDAIAKAAKEHHILLECNNSSYTPGGSRDGSREKAGQMLEACKKYGTTIIMGSDAHIDLDVGNHKYAQDVIRMYDFPGELIINSRPELFKEWIR